MLLIPLQTLPNQTVTTALNNQQCQIDVYQTAYGLFMDLYVSNVLIIGGVICENLNRIVRSVYLGFSGDFVFFDTMGTSDPDYTGLGQDTSARYQLLYLTPEEII